MSDEIECLATAVTRLGAAGYTDDFRAEPGGLRAVVAGCIHPARDFHVDEVVRFEGITDPDDEAIVLALHCLPHGVRGTFVTPYGPKLSGVDGETLRTLTGGPR